MRKSFRNVFYDLKSKLPKNLNAGENFLKIS